MWTFVYMDKSKKDKYLPRLYDILYNNMSVIVPTGNTKKEDYAVWHNAVSEGLEKPPRQILLIKYGKRLAGYMQYYINNSTLVIEELELKPEYQRTSAIIDLCRFMFALVGGDVEYIESYANAENDRSIALQLHFGLELVGSINGRMLHFKAKTSDIVKKHPYIFSNSKKEVVT